jgi:hypothetical protein
LRAKQNQLANRRRTLGTNQRGASETLQATARRLEEAVKDWEKNIEVGSKPSKPRRWKDLRALDKKVICQFTFRRNCFSDFKKKMPKEAQNLPFIGMDCIRKKHKT